MLMQTKTKEQWQILCELAQDEQDPDKLIALIREINRLLVEKRSRLESESPGEENS
jgi:hypothetical protein